MPPNNTSTSFVVFILSLAFTAFKGFAAYVHWWIQWSMIRRRFVTLYNFAYLFNFFGLFTMAAWRWACIVVEATGIVPKVDRWGYRKPEAFRHVQFGTLYTNHLFTSHLGPILVCSFVLSLGMGHGSLWDVSSRFVAEIKDEYNAAYFIVTWHPGYRGMITHIKWLQPLPANSSHGGAASKFCQAFQTKFTATKFKATKFKFLA